MDNRKRESLLKTRQRYNPQRKRQLNMDSGKRESLIKTVEIRLEGVREASKRGRFAFVVMTIASCAIFVVLWNAHFSWNRKSAFPSDMPLDVKNCESVEEPEEKQRCFQVLEIKKSNSGQVKSVKYTGLRDKPCTDETAINNKDITDQNVNCVGNTVQLSEFNRRNRATEWTKSTNISIGLLGVTVHSNDLHTIGTATLAVISLWFVFSIRRENRTIVALLRDIFKDTGFINKRKDGDEWDIANLAFQGIINNMIFVSVTKSDYPMGPKDIVSETAPVKTASDKLTYVELTTLIARQSVFLLFFSPVVTIFLIIIWDWQSLNYNTAFSEGFVMIGDNPKVTLTLFKYSMFALACLILALSNCFAALVLSRRTKEAMEFFREMLDDPQNPEIKEKIDDMLKETTESNEISGNKF